MSTNACALRSKSGADCGVRSLCESGGLVSHVAHVGLSGPRKTKKPKNQKKKQQRLNGFINRPLQVLNASISRAFSGLFFWLLLSRPVMGIVEFCTKIDHQTPCRRNNLSANNEMLHTLCVSINCWGSQTFYSRLITLKHVNVTSLTGADSIL